MNDEKLIELVRTHNVLYNLSNPKYMDTEFKNTIWAKIGEEIEATGQSCKVRWANIRDNFRKSLKKNKTASGQKAKPGKVYKYSEQLNFLKDFFNERETKSNIGDETRSQDMSGDEEMIKSPEDNETQQPATELDSSVIEKPQCYVLDTPTQPSSSVNSTQHKKRNLSSQGKIIPKTAAATVMEYLIKEKESKSSLTTQSPDPVDAFLAGITPALKKLPPRDWHFAKAEMFSVMQKYEFKMIMEGEQSERSPSRSHLSTPTPTYSGLSSPVEGYNQCVTENETQHLNVGQPSSSLNYSGQQYFHNYQ